MKDRNFLIEMYNATTEEFPKGSDEIETYEHWLEKQLLSKINSTPPETKTSEEIDKLAKERFPNKLIMIFYSYKPQDIFIKRVF